MSFKILGAALIGIWMAWAAGASAHNRDAIAPATKAPQVAASHGEVKVAFAGAMGFAGCVRMLTAYNRSLGGQHAQYAEGIAMYDCSLYFN